MANELTTLTQKLALITQEIGAIKKEKKQGSTVSYAFRGIDDVMNKLNPLLGRHGITLQSQIINHNLDRRDFTNKYGDTKIAYCATVTLRLIFSDGVATESWEEVAMSEDYGDKAMTQAMSMAYKYAITRKFCILTEDVVDPDSRNPDRSEELKKPTTISKPSKTQVSETQPTDQNVIDANVITVLSEEIKKNTFKTGTELLVNKADFIDKAKLMNASEACIAEVEKRIVKFAEYMTKQNTAK